MSRVRRERRNHSLGSAPSSQPTPSSPIMADTVYAPHSSTGQSIGSMSSPNDTSLKDEKKSLSEDRVVDEYEVGFYDQEGHQKFKQLSWPRLSLLLIVEAIALGALSLPHAYATVGLPAGVVMTVCIGLITIYTSYLVGQVCNRKWDIEVLHYTDIGYLLGGTWGREILGVCFVLFLILLTGSHALTGSIALDTIADGRACKLIWSVVSAVVLFFLALPTTFEKVAILGYIDFCSIIAAIIITMIATGIRAHKDPGGISASDWSATSPSGTRFIDAFNSVTDIVFAFSFAVCQPSFQAELKKPNDYMKSVWALGIAEIIIYTLTGSIIYVFVGSGVEAPALLSAGHTISRIAFGVALPVIYISGSINTTTAARYIHVRVFKNSPHKYINTPLGITVWVGLCAGLVVISWVIAEAIPFFSSLLSVISALLISGFTFYLPALMWFVLLREGKWTSRKNILLGIINSLIVLGGLTILGAGMYSAAMSIKEGYEDGSVGHPFECQWGVKESS